MSVICFYPTSSAARALGVSRQRLRQLVALGRVSVAARTPRGFMLFDATRIERLRRERERQRRVE